MPLSGLVDGERVVSTLLSEEDWTALKADARANKRTITMSCGWPGVAKTSKLGTPHFAHSPGGDACSAGETAQHLLAKAIIVAAIAAAGWDPEPEARGDGWIADVMATRNGVRVAFEVQWSRQSLDEFAHRQQRYKDAGIASIAWFARHTDRLPTTDRDLPIFPLTISDDCDATIEVHQRRLPLSEVVERLLTRRLAHREFYADERPADALLEGAVMDCYRCKKRFGVWNLNEVRVKGRCGATGIRGRGVYETFPTARPETDPAIREAGERLAATLGVTPARLGRRSTQASGTNYMAFICPHCNATCGEMFVARQFDPYGDNPMVEAKIPATAVHNPHWCLAAEEGVCSIPPSHIAQEALPPEDDRRSFQGGVSVQSVGTPGGISINQALGRMFGGY